MLVGAPGSGKSTVAARLAEHWQLPLIDVDDELADRVGGRLTDAFIKDADAYSELLERVGLDALGSEGVVALSSAAVESAAVRSALEGLEVDWLRASVSTLTRRLGMNRLGMTELIAIRNRMDAQLQLRARWYSAVATRVVDTDRLTAEQVAVWIIEGGAR